MPGSNSTEILLAHNTWATRNIITACEPLTAEQFHQKFEMGPGSLHDTITHMLGATRGWTDLLTAREDRPRIEAEGKQRTPSEFLPLFEEVFAEFNTAAHAHPPEELVSRARGGKMYTFSRGAVLVHVTTHGMHHRAQCLNMLRHVGVDPMPKSSVLEWMISGEPAS